MTTNPPQTQEEVDAWGTEARSTNGKPKKKRRKRKPSFTIERTELDLADMLVERFGSELRYCGPLGGWFTRAEGGTHWQRDDQESARECVKAIAKDIAREAVELLELPTFRTAKRAGSASGARAILELARSTPGIVFRPEDVDRDPWLLNCENGTLDLRTGKLRAHDPADLITRVCPVEYDPDAKCPTFDRFLSEVQPKTDVRDYLARLFGYASTALIRDHMLGVFWGPGANGKTVLADVVTHVLGDYAKPGPSSLIVRDGTHQPHPTDVASCVGSRLVVVHETNRGASFDASKAKLLTGGDKLTARFMRQDYFVFSPTHTLIMLSNYKPEADATDAALWRRVQLVPFEVVIPESDRDLDLAEKIKANESAGVLRWIVEGALQWQQKGLAPPDVVRTQTEAYRASEDVIGAFLKDCTVRNEAAKVRAGVLYAAFKKWCDEQGARPVRGNDFAAELKGRGFSSYRESSGVFYKGLGLHAAEYEDER